MSVKQLIKTYYPALLILTILLAFTLFAAYNAGISAKNRRARLFELRVKEATQAIENRFTDYTQILKGCQSLFYAADTVDFQEWQAYTENLQVGRNYPGIQALAYAAYIPKENVNELTDQLRQSGYPKFRVRSTFKEPVLTPIIYIVPFNRMNQRAFGYDMYSERNRREAMERAITTGEPSLTKTKLTLVQEGTNNVQPGFLMYLPVYKNPKAVRTAADRKREIRGFVYHAFRAYDLMDAILKDFSNIRITLYASETISPRDLLYTSKPSGEARAAIASEFSSDTTIQVAGANWKIVIASNEAFGSRIEKREPVLIFAFGLAISGLLFAMAIINIRHRAEIAEELNLTRELELKKDEFIGIASHELKTPLTSIKAYMQLLERSELSNKDKTFVNKANSNIEKLNSLIGDLLDISKIQAGRLQFNLAPFKLKEMIEESVENVQHMYSTHQIIKPDVMPDVTMIGDKLRLEQALNNFLVNAVKYSPGADKVFVRAFVQKNEVTVEVEDRGIGVSEEFQAHIFDRFYRVDEVSPVISGLGVGLYITSEIIKRHHGKIGLRSEPGKGSTFYFCLPTDVTTH